MTIIVNFLVVSNQISYSSNINQIFSIEYSELTSEILVNQNSLITDSTFFYSNDNLFFSILTADSKVKIISHNGLSVKSTYTTDNSIVQNNSGLRVNLGFIPISVDEIIILDHKEFESNTILINCTFKKIDSNGNLINSSLSTYSGYAVSRKQESNASTFYNSQLIDACFIKYNTVNYLLVLTLDKRRITSNSNL